MYIVWSVVKMASVILAIVFAGGMADIALQFWEISRIVSVCMGIAAAALFIPAMAVFIAPFLKARRL